MQNHLTTYQHYKPQAMAGFWSWVKKAAKAVFKSVVTAMPFTKGDVWTVLEDLSDGDGMFGGQHFGSLIDFNEAANSVGLGPQRQGGMLQTTVGDLPLTAQDESGLDRWLDLKFIPYFKSKLQNLKTANESGVTVSAFLDIYNETYLMISFFDWYHTQSGVVGLDLMSENAKISRHQLIKSQMRLLEDQLQIYVDEKGIQLETGFYAVDINTQDFNALGFFPPTTIQLEAKQATQLLTNVVGGNEVTITNQEGVSEAVIPASPTTDKSKPNYLAISIGIIAVYALYNNRNKK